MDWFVGLVLVGALIYWFFSREPEEPSTPDKNQEKPRKRHKFERTHNIEPETVEKRNIAGHSSPIRKTESLSEMLKKLALVNQSEQDTPKSYVQIMVAEGRFIGMNAATFNAALAGYKPMIKSGNALQRRADRLKHGSPKGPEIAGEMEVMAAKLIPHIEQLESGVDIVFSDREAPVNKIFNLIDKMDDIRDDLERTAEELRDDAW